MHVRYHRVAVWLMDRNS